MQQGEHGDAASDLAEQALALCLQQHGFHQPGERVAINLMRVSKRLAALVTAICSGTLALRTNVETPTKADALAAWLSRHGGLLVQLTLHLYDWATATRQLWQSAAPVVRLLERLPGTLLDLEVCINGTWHAADAAAQEAAALARALSRQPVRLRRLTLPLEWKDQTATVLPALAALRRLTALDIAVPDDVSQLQGQLPVQLRQLCLRCPFGSGTPSASLSPWLAALQHVTFLQLSDAVVSSGTHLPPRVQTLSVDDISDVTPLQELAQLTELWVNACSAPAEQLRCLSRLGQLQELHLKLSDRDQFYALDDAAEALGVLPLTYLSAGYATLTCHCLAHLGSCTRLTHLELFSCIADSAAAMEQVAPALARLTALQFLLLVPEPARHIDGDCFWQAASWAPVCAALARLPRLSTAEFSYSDIGPAAAASIALLTQVTELVLDVNELDDASVVAMASRLTRLQCLSIDSNEGITDSGLAALAALPQLTWLSVHETSVTAHGLQQLRALRPALQVDA